MFKKLIEPKRIKRWITEKDGTTMFTLWCQCQIVQRDDKPIEWKWCRCDLTCRLSYDERQDLLPVRKEREE